ncbi:hypothetical protein B296_00057036 [Ensete ventricosum]|uniref:Uncharacterized protein n=1 Tax=Ensete ventricosum TaxID=4639 RepID=A0A426XSV9_ENSVE|nr:hypothetical protein B296_00057036 [Ensete ventricosum]
MSATPTPNPSVHFLPLPPPLTISPFASAVGAFCHLLCRCSEPSIPLLPTESSQLPLLSAVRCRYCCPLPLLSTATVSLSAAAAAVCSTDADVLD